jgi:muramidase (phage lysozyme)
MLFGGALFDSFADHPRIAIKSPWGWTSAAGAYQAMCAVPGKVKTDTWGDFIRSQGPHDFSPSSQDAFAIWCIKRRGALKAVEEGFFDVAVKLCAKEWASLPFSPYGQPTKTIEQARAIYKQYGGKFSDEMASSNVEAGTPLPVTQDTVETVTTPTQSGPYMRAGEGQPQEYEMPLDPIVAAVLPSIIESIPKLGKLFGSGSDVAERNVKAAEMAVGIVQEAVGAVNAQDAAEKVKSDPAMATVAAKAVEAQWLTLTEAGGDGIAGARRADAAFVAASSSWYDFLKSPSFLVALLLTPLVYLIVLSLIGMIGTAQWSDDVRSGLAGSIISAVIGGLVGYYFGQVTSRNR